MNKRSSNRRSNSLESGFNESLLDYRIGNASAKPSTIQSSNALPNTSDSRSTSSASAQQSTSELHSISTPCNDRSSSHNRSTLNEATEHHAAFVDTEDYDNFSDCSGELSHVTDELPVLGTCVALFSFNGELRVLFRRRSLF